MNVNFTFLLSFLSFYILLSFSATAADKPSFEEYVATLSKEAISKGYDPDLVAQGFANINYKPKVVKADKNQPEFKQTLGGYLNKRITPWVVNKAVALYQEKQIILNKIGQHYGVQPRFIVALWGLESSFGKHKGSYPVLASLTTLAYEGRREALYRRQIFAALDILQQRVIALEDFKGSWAGAMGQTQFMPTSFLAYAEDFDQDGKKDIWFNEEDVFASIANYLKQEGWKDDLTWGRQIKKPSPFNAELAIPKGTKGRSDWLKAWRNKEQSLPHWQTLGFRRADGRNLPTRNISAALILPDDPNSRGYLVYDNFKVLMHWNRSYYFAISVGTLADKIQYQLNKKSS